MVLTCLFAYSFTLKDEWEIACECGANRQQKGRVIDRP
jgi:hypothetical protein